MPPSWHTGALCFRLKCARLNSEPHAAVPGGQGPALAPQASASAGPTAASTSVNCCREGCSKVAAPLLKLTWGPWDCDLFPESPTTL